VAGSRTPFTAKLNFILSKDLKMGIKKEAKEVVLVNELPDHLKGIVLGKNVKRSEVKSIQKEIKLEGKVLEDYD
jgi:hypothetical protein